MAYTFVRFFYIFHGFLDKSIIFMRKHIFLLSKCLLIFRCFLLISLLSFTSLNAATISCVPAGGPWAAPTTWVGGAVPTAADDVIIVAGATVTMNAVGAACLSLTIDAGAPGGILNFNTPALTLTVGTGGLTINAGGNITGAALGTFLGVEGNITLNGGTVSSAQLIVRTQTNPGIIIQGTGGTIANLTINTITTNTTVLTVSAALEGISTLTNGTGATLIISGASGITGLSANAAPNTVVYNGAAGQTVKTPTAPADTYHHLTLTGGGAKVMSGITNINGDFTLSGTVSTSGVNVGITINGKVTIGAGTTFNAGTSLSHTFNGDFQNDGAYTFTTFNAVTLGGSALQTISGASTTAFEDLTLSNTTAPVAVNANSNFDISGTLAINAGSSLNPAAGVVINNTAADGTITGNGTIYVTRIAPAPDYLSQYRFTTNTLSGLTVNYSGLGDQTINNAVSPYANIVTSGSGTKSPDGATTTVTGSITINSPSVLSTASFNLSASSLVNNGTFDGTGGGTVALSGAGTALTNNGTFNAGTASISLTAGSFLNNLSGTFNGGSAIITLSATGTGLVNDGAFSAGSGSFVFSAAGSQSIGGITSPTTFNNLTTNAGGLSLATNVVVDGTLTYNGIVTTNPAFSIAVSGTGSTSGAGAGKYVLGNLYKYVNPGSPSDLTFELGDGASYLPVDFFNITGVATPGYVQMKLVLPANYEVNSTPSSNDIYVVPVSRRVKRTWSLIDQSGGALAIGSFDLRFNFLPSDVDPGTNTANLIPFLYDGVEWRYPPSIGTIGTRTPTSTVLLGSTMANIGNFQLGEPVPPKIPASGQPVNIAQCPGLTATFTVKATGQGLTYQWQSDASGAFTNISDGPLPSGAAVSGSATATLAISGITAAEAVNYRVIVSGYGAPPVTSASAALSLKAPPVITVQPAASTVQCEGTTVVLNINATGTGISYQWTRNGAALTDAGNVSGSASSSLTITNIAAVDAGTYYVQVTGDCTPPHVTSAPAVVTVNTPATITSQPASVNQCAGNNVSFTVAAQGGSLAYQWRLEGVNLSDGGNIAGANTPTLTLTGITLADAGNYDVVVANTCPAAAKSVIAVLTVDEPVTITSQPSSLIQCAGTNASFSAAVSGNSVSYQWRINGVNLSDGARISGSRTSTLSVANISAADAGNYDVVVTNSCATTLTSSVASLTVNAAASISTHPVSINQCEGGNVSFTVGATGSSINYQWRFGGTNLADGGNISGSSTATLTITGITTADAGAYDVVITNSCATTATSNPAVLTVDQPVAITGQPAAVTQCTGTNASFSVTATGNSLNYQWRVNGASLSNGANISGANSATLSIVNISAGDAGTYDVVITNSCGTTATSAGAALTVTAPVNITAQPASVNQCEGTNVTITVGATGSSLNYQWRLGGSNLSDGGNISGANTSSLTLTGIALADAGNYDVVITNSCATTLTSSVAVLTVDQPVAITTQPVSQSQCAGSSISFNAGVSGNSVIYQWRVNGASLTNGGRITGANSATLTIVNISPADAGNYDVVVTNSCAATATSSAAFLNVTNPVNITSQPSSVNQCSGNNVTLTVGATGSGLSYQWRLGGSNLSDGGNISGATTPSLTISSISPADAGSYDVVITNNCAATVISNPAVLTVDEPVAISTQPAPLSQCAGSNASFSVSATGNGLNYQWRVNGTVLTNGGRISGANSSTLTIANVSPADAGNYDVVITNTCATTATSNTASLSVTTPAAITSQPSSVNQCSGNNVTLTVGATGSSLAYQWRRGGVNVVNGGSISGATSASLTITGVLPANAGNYDVVITNSCGTTVTSNVAVLTVDVPVSISSQPSALSRCTGSTAFFSVGASGNGVIYQWRVNGANLSNGGSISGANSSTLTIGNVSSGDEGVYDVVITNSCATTATSAGAALTVSTPAAITGHPASVSQCQGNNVTLTVTANGNNLSYRWRKEGVNLSDGGNISGAATASLTLTGINAADGGNYDVIVTNSCPVTAASNVAVLTVDQPVSITTQPASVTQCIGSNASFTVAATGNSLSYQWRINGINLSNGARISGANGPVLSIANVSAADSGTYDVVITNACLTPVTSAPASLIIAPAAFTGSVIGEASVCEGNNTGTVSLVNFSGTVKRWESSVDQGATWNTVASTSLSLTYTNIVQSTLYRAVIVNGACNDIFTPFAEVFVNAKPKADFELPAARAHVPVTFLNKSTVLGSTINSSSWTFGDGSFSVSANPEHTYSMTGTYRVSLTVTSDKGCADSVSKDLTVAPGEVFMISNLLTLNDNGQNDTWFIEGIEKYPDSEVSIYNRDGQLLFSEAPYKNNWGGTYKGEKLPDGAYFYILHLKNSNVTYKGSIIITR
jgi:gliding motility-associated-like protein